MLCQLLAVAESVYVTGLHATMSFVPNLQR